MKCPKCDFENRESGQYCLNCGEGLMLKCHKCGNMLPLVAKFCDNCGQSYEELVARIETDREIFATLIRELEYSNMTLKEVKNQFEKFFLEKKLQEFHWNISNAAKAMGIDRSNLHRKIKSYKLEPFNN